MGTERNHTPDGGLAAEYYDELQVAANSSSHLRVDCRLARAGRTVRLNEPVTAGLPFPKGVCRQLDQLSLRTADGAIAALQSTALDWWSDGSVRWALLDFQATCPADADGVYHLEYAPHAVAVDVNHPVSTVIDGDTATVDTGVARFTMRSDGSLRSVTGDAPGRDDVTANIRVTSHDGRVFDLSDGRLSTEHSGPLRTVILFTATLRLDASPRRLHLFVRYHFFAGQPTVRVQLTVRNPHRAVHEGGYWELGDAGSQLLRDLSFVIRIAEGTATVRSTTSIDAPPRAYATPFALVQESSGGEQWNSIAHVNRDRVVPMRTRGYVLTAGDERAVGTRATPIVAVGNGQHSVAVAHARFWERFPKAITVTDTVVRLGLLPSEFPDLHELQGGEQITEEFVVAFGPDLVSEEPLEWVRDPLQFTVSPEWYCGAEAMPHLIPAAVDLRHDYLALAHAVIDGADSFGAKRELTDEYGWRHFGDLYADHETVHHTGEELFISHYNNQYDAAAGLAIHFFRTGNRTALTLFDDLMRHVVDVDIYHTTEDRPAYNHGLFWHTAHHTNAGKATHRTYPRSSGASGGPSAEHNYNTGLMLHYFMTGDCRAREGAVDLAQWVIDMDDGRLTALRWLSRAPTGYASATGSFDYHGPGRGPGNGIVVLLNAFRLTGERRFMDKAEELIRRCVHPTQDLEALDLLDTERRWYYTVFLQAIGRYLGVKEERGEIDATYDYARATLLHYARWMSVHEYPYLEKPERLEFPNETWAAQDMRKSDVFKYATLYADGTDEHALFLARSQFFFDYSVGAVGETPNRRFARPAVLLLTNGYSHVQNLAVAAPRPLRTAGFGGPRRFDPQRRIAVNRLLAAGILGVVTAVVGALYFVGAFAGG